MQRHLFLTTLSLLISAWPLPAAKAFVLENIVWGIPNPTIYVNLTASQAQLGGNLASFPLMDGSSSYNQVFSGAAATWNSCLENLQIQTVNGTNSQGVNENNSLSEAGFGSSVGGSNFGGDTLAVTEIYYTPGNPNTFAPTDIVFNVAFAWNSYRGALLNSPIDLRRVALHELGHFIGLNHPDQAGQVVNAIMNSVISNTDNLTADDIAGGQYLYGARSPIDFIYAPKAGDFNGDGKQDLFWRDSSANLVSVWLMNGLTIGSDSQFAWGTSTYRVFGFADFDGDGKSDVVWQNTADNSIIIWLMQGADPSTSVTVSPPETNYVLAAIGDLDGDGKADLVWRNPTTGDVIGQKNNGIVNGTLSLSTEWQISAGTFWNVIATANLDGNPKGQVELVWRGLDGTVAAWFFSGFQPVQYPIYAQPDSRWTLVAVADCNGDGKDDLVWFDAQDRLVGVWYMNGMSVYGWGAVGNMPSPWVFAGAANVNGPGGRAQLFWTNPSNSQIVTWSLQNPSQASASLTSLIAAPVWSVQPQVQ